MMRRILVGALALVGLVALSLASACGGGGEEEEEVTPGASPPVEAGVVNITFWHSMTAANEDTLESLTDKFNASQDRVHVSLAFQGSYTDSLNKVLASVGAGDLPALVQLEDTATRRLVDSGAFVPAQDFIDEEDYDLSDFYPRIIDYYTADGKLWPAPFNVSNPILFYNAKAFEEVGLDPEKPPRTVDEIREYSEKLLKKDASGNVVRTGIALEISPWFMEQMMAAHGDTYVNNGNGREDRATEATFDTEGGLKFFQWWDEMVDTGLGISVGRNPGGADHLLAIGAGRAVMTVATSAALRSVLNVLESGQFPDVRLAIGPMPHLFEGDSGVLVGGAALWIFKDQPQERQEAAWEFIKFLVAPEQQSEWFAGSGYLPIRLSARALPAAQEAVQKYPFFDIAIDQLLEDPPDEIAGAGPLMGPYDRIREAVATAIEGVVVGGLSPDQALKQAVTQATQEIEEYERRFGG